jgi:cytochrome c oxidase subunit IV
MAAHGAEDIQKQVRTYFMVFGALAVLTVITVAISYVHLPMGQAVTLAMAVALIKGTLVAGVFMHLFSERKTIYWVLILCVLMFVPLMIGPLLTDVETIRLEPVQAAAHLETGGVGH